MSTWWPASCASPRASRWPISGLSQDSMQIRGAAMQCRITTEDPANGFRPDTGRITGTGHPGGAGIRLDGGTHPGRGDRRAFRFDAGQADLPGPRFPTRGRRARRALAEFRIRGVSTNIPFLQAVLDDPDFRAGRVTTSFIDERPQLLTARIPADRGTKILNYLADVTVNQPHGPRPSTVYPHDKLPEVDLTRPPPPGQQAAADGAGAGGFRALAARHPGRRCHRHHLPRRAPVPAGHPGAHHRLLVVAPYIARMTPQLLSIECWGGATYDVALRFLKEDPWERLAALREAVPNICLQMLLRGRNTVGYTPVPGVGDPGVRRRGHRDRDRHLPDLRRAEQRRVDAPGHRCGPRNRLGGRRSRDELHRRPVRSRREPVHPGLLPASSPSRSSMPVRTCWRSRTWRGCCARRPRPRWSARCAAGSICRCTCTPMTPRAGSWPPTSRPGRPAPARSTARPRRWRAPPASPH